MGFSSIAVEQRQKEIKALKPFLAFSVISSLVLHIAVLASGIGNLFAIVPSMEEQPIELTYVDPEIKETPKAVETKQEKPSKDELGATGGGKVLTAQGGGGGGGSISLGGGSSTAQPQSRPFRQNPPVVEQKQPREQPFVPVPRVENFKALPKQQTQPPKEPQKVATAPQRQIEPSTPTKTDPETLIEKLKHLLIHNRLKTDRRVVKN
jgi:hypothetical protein